MSKKVVEENKSSNNQKDLKKLQDFIRANNIQNVLVALFDKSANKVQSFTDLSNKNRQSVAQHISCGLQSFTQSGSSDNNTLSSDDLMMDVNESTLESGKKTNICSTDMQ